MDKHGTKELSEAITGLMELSLYMAELMKDGFQISDVSDAFQKFMSDEDFKAKLVEAAKGANKIPAEAKDINLEEGMALVMQVVPYVSKMIKVFSK